MEVQGKYSISTLWEADRDLYKLIEPTAQSSADKVLPGDKEL